MDIVMGDLIFEDGSKTKQVDRNDVIDFWRQHAPGLSVEQTQKRLEQLVYVVRRKTDRSIVAESTAEEILVKQLRNYFFNIRFMVVRENVLSPGLLGKLITETFQVLEEKRSFSRSIGVITLIENERLKQVLTKAILPASGLVFIGNSPRGHQIRVRYFENALIN